MRRFFTFFGVLGLCGLVSTRGDAQTTALIAVDDATQIAELQLAKVMAEDSSLWLSVRLRGHSRLALVTAESASESAVAADAWLRALDFATRMRVAPPPGPLASCGSLTQFELSDSGAPESQRILASEIVSETSELGLRRRLADFGLPVDVSRVAQFTGRAQPPFRVALYDASAFGGSTDALRLVDRGHSEELPIIETSGTSTLPVSAILLAKSGVQPVVQGSADASEFPVSYRLVDASSDYLSARANWLAQNPERWLNEVQDGAALFSGTVFPTGDRLASVVSRYLSGLPAGATGPCLTKFRAAHERSSTNAADFACDDADDLAQALTELDFAEPRLNRFHGIIGADGERFRIASDGSHTPLLFATDFDQSGCSQPVTPPESGANPPMSPPVATTPVVVSTPVEPDDTPIPNTTAGTYSEVSCTGSVADSSSNDSCSGDSSSSESSSDDSCSGDSSSSESSSDSCNGSSSDSEYDGDTCSGNSAGSNPSRAKSAALRVDTAGRSSPRRAPHQRPRHVRLSLLTWLVAALALPLRRLSASR
ncbi:MAG TPA: hypothetical protein VER11_27210 [Polyangiaceae bacterium]|nr:hypothetical protein [Polyangiaceae bacterium]